MLRKRQMLISIMSILVEISLLILLMYLSFTESFDPYHQITDILSDPECAPRLHNKDSVMKAVVNANALLDKAPTDIIISDRLMVSILFSHGFDTTVINQHQRNRITVLHCCLSRLFRRAPKTPMDVYIWVVGKVETLTLPSWLKDFPRVFVVQIPEWKVPCGLIPDKDWLLRDLFDINYYQMMRFRLTFSPDFAKEMGYKFHLQLDDDSIMYYMVNFNMVNNWKSNNTEMAFFPELSLIPVKLVLGLPELTRYWLRVHGYQPVGEIYDNCNPGNIDGLTTEGWNKMAHAGYFIMINVDFWFRDEIQSYLTMMLRLGRDIEGFYTEQEIMMFINLIFVRKDRKALMKEIDIYHNKKDLAYHERCLNEAI